MIFSDLTPAGPTGRQPLAMPSSSSSSSLVTFDKLEQAALHIVQLVADTPGLGNTRLAVIGDLAVCKYLRQDECPSSIEFIVSKSSSPSRVRKEIVGHPMTPLVERSQTVFYRHQAAGWEIEVRFTPDWLCPYLPAAARSVRDIVAVATTGGGGGGGVRGSSSTGTSSSTSSPPKLTLPYASLEDMFVFKADACSLRDSAAGKQREARLAAALLERGSRHSVLELAEDNRDRVGQCLDDLVAYSSPEHDKSWWQKRLGFATDKRRSVQEILSELADMPRSPTSPSSSSSFSGASMGSPTTSSSCSSSVYFNLSREPSFGHSSSSSVASSSASSSVGVLPPMVPEKPGGSSNSSSGEKFGRPRKMSVVSRPPRHKRNSSIESPSIMSPVPGGGGGGALKSKSLSTAFQALDMQRSVSPGISLTNRI
ncbi:hypothetical protein F4778DRAFT_778627 [Xylariomycetidae sp. FL2044]|nr:hypothetical protein F4778DRAFT_778627 [Xylariomycetidae sp. FL2044]